LMVWVRCLTEAESGKWVMKRADALDEV
jgi:hypothetical protein